jgi:BMFP domain-containing protein YqiC
MNSVYYGKDSVANYIKHVNIPNYRIYVAERSGSQAIPIFSSLTGSIKTAISDFNTFSENILMGNVHDDTVYYIKFYKDHNKVSGHIAETYYSYNKEKESAVTGIGGGGNSFNDIIGIIQHVMPMAKAQAENELLKQRLDDLENRDEETGINKRSL